MVDYVPVFNQFTFLYYQFIFYGWDLPRTSRRKIETHSSTRNITNHTRGNPTCFCYNCQAVKSCKRRNCSYKRLQITCTILCKCRTYWLLKPVHISGKEWIRPLRLVTYSRYLCKVRTFNRAIFHFDLLDECVQLTISDRLCFLCFPKIWSMSYHGLVRLVQNKECYFMFSYTFFPFLLFSIKKFALLSLL